MAGESRAIITLLPEQIRRRHQPQINTDGTQIFSDSLALARDRRSETAATEERSEPDWHMTERRGYRIPNNEQEATETTEMGQINLPFPLFAPVIETRDPTLKPIRLSSGQALNVKWSELGRATWTVRAGLASSREG